MGEPSKPERRNARGYSWPPATVGNTLAQKHGAHSPRVVQPIADHIAAQIYEVAPWTASPAFAGAVASLSWAEAQALVLRKDIDEHGSVDDDGEATGAAKLLDRIEGRLAKLRDQLGLTPQSLSKLLTSAATLATATGDTGSLAALQAEGQQLLDARYVPTDPPAVEAGTTDTKDHDDAK